MSGTYFQGNKDHPQHLSVGAILVNGSGEICCHHFHTEKLKGYWADERLDDFYILMRETPEPGEPLEETLKRGLMEELGATATLLDYIGSIQSRFLHEGVEVEKTTLYFLCRLESQDLAKRSGDIESASDIEWRTASYLIPLMKAQAKRFGRTDVDESPILERARMLGKI